MSKHDDMSESIDVLAVMRRDATDAARLRSPQDSAYVGRCAVDSVIAMANVSELIEAGFAATEERMHDGASSEAACDRLVAAIAACKGGAA